MLRRTVGARGDLSDLNLMSRRRGSTLHEGGTGDGDDKLKGWAYILRAAGAVLTQASPVNQACIQLVMYYKEYLLETYLVP